MSNLVRFRIFRRRHKYSFLLSVVILVITFFFIFNSGLSLQSMNPFGSKTVPFVKTQTAANSGLEPQTHTKIVKNDEKLKLLNELPTDKRLEIGHDYFYNVFKLLNDAKPSIKELSRYPSKERIYHAGYEVSPANDKSPIFSEEYLYKFLQLNDDEVVSMRESHEKVVNGLPDTYPAGLYKGNGIVYVGGGKFNWLTLLSIKSLRKVGSELPVEVIIPTLAEYEVDLCGKIFPSLNARCVLLSKVLGDKITGKFSFAGYQYKAIAILASSFENVLLLDSDNVPVHSPDYLFESKPFTTNGLISWPDFWKRATSPYYYKIAGMKVSEERVRFGYNEYGTYPEGAGPESSLTELKDLKKIPLHDRKGAIPDPTSESGQLMVSKKTHLKAMFLALYYNLYGPSHFYPLFSQGSDGEGDKETFIAATVVLNKKVYQVNKFLNAFGYFDLGHNFVGTGMGQYDPVEDYKILQIKSQMAGHSAWRQNHHVDPLVKEGPRILFVHANFPKLNPWELKQGKKIVDKNGDRLRLYGTGMRKRCGYDFETVQWNNMQELICQLKIDVDAFEDIDRVELCKEINEHLDYLKSSVDELET